MEVCDYLEPDDHLKVEDNSSSLTRGLSVKSTRLSVRRKFRKLSATLSGPQLNLIGKESGTNHSDTNEGGNKRTDSFRRPKKKHPAEQWPPKFDSLLPEYSNNRSRDGVRKFTYFGVAMKY